MTVSNDNSAEHYPFCDRPTHTGGKSACGTPTTTIPGVNLGTWAAFWVTAEDSYPLPPTAANLDLGKGDAPLPRGTTLYLDVRGLRDLAAAANQMADLLEQVAA